MSYAPTTDKKGNLLQPGDRVRIKLSPRWKKCEAEEGTVEISTYSLTVMRDGTCLPSLVVRIGDKTYGLPDGKAIKIA